NTTGVNTGRILLCHVDLAEGKTQGLPEAVEELLEFFREQGQNFYEAEASMLLAEVNVAIGQVRKAVEPVRRALDLSARFDYDYWIRAQIRRNPKLFSIEEIAERLPSDLKKELGAKPAERVIPASVSLAAPIITDLSIRVLGHPEIFRDPEKPFAPD